MHAFFSFILVFSSIAVCWEGQDIVKVSSDVGDILSAVDEQFLLEVKQHWFPFYFFVSPFCHHFLKNCFVIFVVACVWFHFITVHTSHSIGAMWVGLSINGTDGVKVSSDACCVLPQWMGSSSQKLSGRDSHFVITVQFWLPSGLFASISCNFVSLFLPLHLFPSIPL